jgi:DNA mismatch repair protein MutL
MEDIIRLLPDSIANQIAAGEVVQRPASVVKELLENSIDAGATEIKLIVRESGKSLIQVIDDGKGMSGTDARMAFERHATSKIQTAEDLFRIRSMGFRGEALASIAAVAQVELKTRRAQDELGHILQIEASEVKKQEPAGCSGGTSICVRNLFYNTPARRNFLKSNPVELRHINDEIQRVMLANPHVRFRFVHNDQEVMQLEDGKLSKRIVQIFGKNYQKQLIPVQEETPDIKVTGYIGKPENAKKTRGEQFFFVNNRFIRSAYQNKALVNAYQGLIGDDYFPFYVLFIEMDPQLIDINVHPTKTEVKFQDDRLLFSVIQAAAKQALASFNVTPSLDFDTDVNFEQYFPGRQERSGGTFVGNTQERNYAQFKTIERPNAKNWESLYAGINREEELHKLRAEREIEGPEKVVTFPSKMDRVGSQSHLSQEVENKKTLQLHGRYLLRQVKSGMVMIDQRAAHERILFERYLQRFKHPEGVSQSCLFPQQLELNPSDMSLVMEIRPEVRKLGFEYEEFGKNCIVINGVPSEIINASEKQIFEGLIEQYKQNQSSLSISTEENLARSLAKRTAIQAGKVLQEQEADHLFDQLFACEQPNYTVDGLPTFVVLSLDKIASFFKT